MLTMRAPRACAKFFKERDPGTAINESYIRRLIANGDIPVIRNGKKVLVSVESIDEYLSKSLNSKVDDDSGGAM